MTRFAILWLLALLLGACRSAAPPDNYYLLTAESPVREAPGDLTVGVGPVEIPDYLQRSEIAWYLDGNSLTVDPGERWAEDLDLGIARVIAANLARLGSAGTVLLYPWRQNENPVYSLRLDIRAMNRDGANAARLEAAWRLVEEETGDILERGVFNREQSMDGFSYPSLVAAWSELLAQLSVELDAALRRHSG